MLPERSLAEALLCNQSVVAATCCRSASSQQIPFAGGILRSFGQRVAVSSAKKQRSDLSTGADKNGLFFTYSPPSHSNDMTTRRQQNKCVVGFFQRRPRSLALQQGRPMQRQPVAILLLCMALLGLLLMPEIRCFAPPPCVGSSTWATVSVSALGRDSARSSPPQPSRFAPFLTTAIPTTTPQPSPSLTRRTRSILWLVETEAAPSCVTIEIRVQGTGNSEEGRCDTSDTPNTVPQEHPHHPLVVMPSSTYVHEPLVMCVEDVEATMKVVMTTERDEHEKIAEEADGGGAHSDREPAARDTADDATASSQHDDEERIRRVKQTAKAAALLARKAGSASSGKRTVSSAATTKATSVGTRRVGSATKAQSSGRSTTRLLDAVKTGNRVKKASSGPTSKSTQKYEDSPNTRTSASTRPSRAMIEAAVDSMIEQTRPSRGMGLLGEALHSVTTEKILTKPRPGTLLLRSRLQANNSDSNTAGNVLVRAAKPADDLDIANLRLSVFSNFSPETRKAFCDRSCHLLSTRRHRGATCIVALADDRKHGPFLSPPTWPYKDRIVGTAEISFHEFVGTRLGMARPNDAVLYVTEVAVNQSYRRKGIAKLLMKAVDKIASLRKIETVYLHVDTENKGAIRLYRNAGYRILPKDNPIFSEFTRKLNLHDGFTKGRKHFLLAKDLKTPTWNDYDTSKFPSPGLEVDVNRRGTLGIEVEVSPMNVL